MEHADGDLDAAYDPSMSRVESAVVALVGVMAGGLLASAVGLGVVYSQTQTVQAVWMGAVAVFGAGVIVSVVAGARLLARHYGRHVRPVRLVGRVDDERDA